MTRNALGLGVALACVLAWGGAVQAVEVTRPPGGPVPAFKPDLRIKWIEFRVRRTETDSVGKVTYFGAYVTVVNTSTGDAGPFDVLLEHSMDSSNGPWSACGACKIHVNGLKGKNSVTLDPREFNVRAGRVHYFRATADIDNTVNEANEHNNTMLRQYP